MDALIDALKDENVQVRATAIHALGKIGHHKAIEPIEYRIQNDQSEFVREAARTVLKEIRIKRQY